MSETTAKTRRGTSNGNSSGNSYDRRRRKERLVEEWRSDFDAVVALPGTSIEHVWTWVPVGTVEVPQDAPAGSIIQPTARCWRCGTLLTVKTVTSDRKVPGCVKTKRYPNGGTYAFENLRPACGGCNSSTGGKLARRKP
jgi:5-methylcytosine-specific restriction endonuclease McrA